MALKRANYKAWDEYFRGENDGEIDKDYFKMEVSLFMFNTYNVYKMIVPPLNHTPYTIVREAIHEVLKAIGEESTYHTINKWVLSKGLQKEIEELCEEVRKAREELKREQIVLLVEEVMSSKAM